MTEKRFAVFIPCYNAAATISGTLSSVNDSIEKTGLAIPVFIYDDCSSDDSLRVAEKSWTGKTALHILRNPENTGERKTTNRAFADFFGKFDWVFIIHADDKVKKEWLPELIELISKRDDASYFTIWCSYDTFNDATGKQEEGDNSGVIQDIVRDEQSIKYYLTKAYSNWHISGAALNVELYNRLQGFDINMAQFGDTDFFVRGLMAGYRDVYVSRTLTWYRLSEGSVSSVSFRTNRDIREIYLLIDKFRPGLKSDELNRLYKIIKRISGRRMLRCLKNRDFSLAWLNFKEFGKVILK